MGRVSTGAQWLIIAAGVLLSPVFVVLLVLVSARTLGRLLRRKLSPRPTVAPQSARDRGPLQLRGGDAAQCF
jgi:hypothetical protein